MLKDEKTLKRITERNCTTGMYGVRSGQNVNLTVHDRVFFMYVLLLTDVWNVEYRSASLTQVVL